MLLIVAVALLAGLAGGFLLGRCKPQHGPAPSQNATQEGPSPEFAARLDRTDQALRATLKALRLEPVQPPETEERQYQGAPYTFTTIRLPHTDRQVLHERLVKELAGHGSGARLHRAEPDALELRVDGAPTHRLLLEPEEPEAPSPAERPGKPAPASKAKARVAIVIDDMGEDVALARELAAMSVPVAFAIWPDSGQREAVLKIAKAAGREVLIHLPMEPEGYPKVKPGPHPLLTSMTADQIRAAAQRAVERVPGAIGVNNHMGSRFTQSRLGMRAALGVIREHGLFFLDSRTSPASLGLDEAKRQGMRAYRRDVFLDNEQDAERIVKQLRKLEAVALKQGQAIALGHPHKATVVALKRWLKDKDPGVQMVPVSSLPAR